MKAWPLLLACASATVLPDFANQCVGCVLNVTTETNQTSFYCSKTGVCTNVYIENQSCEQGIATCINYASGDMGLLEIPPFTKTKSSLNFTVRNGTGVRLGISNQDSKVTGWFKLMLMAAPPLDPLDPDDVAFTAADTTVIPNLASRILTTVPSGVNLYYYNQNTGSTSVNYIYSAVGKAYLKPLNTRFLFIGTNSSDVNVFLVYGNTNAAAMLTVAFSAVVLGMALFL